MGQALYRKYRSRAWDEVVGQEHIVSTLKNVAASGKFSHAYLFSGPRGTGKTSVARLLARQINGLDYQGDEPHIDIIEIDAASNTSVDDIRDLREKISVAPTLAKYKIYIIDEVHMISKSAANALLKTLEEPPAHVIFILATTDPQKLPETILSRVQHFNFKPVSQKLVEDHLKSITKAEGIKIDDGAVELIARLGEGSMRDSLSLLDQLAASGEKITQDTVESLAGLAPAEVIENLKLAVNSHDPKQLIEVLSDAYASGLRAEAVASQLSASYRQELIASPDVAKLPLIKQLALVSGSYRPEQFLEITLLEACLAHLAQSQPADPVKTGASSASKPRSEPKTEQEAVKDSKPSNETNNTSETTPDQAIDQVELWPAVLEKLRGHHNTLYGIARMAAANLNGGELTLEVAFPFHLKRLSETRNKQIISAIVEELTGDKVAIVCRQNKNLAHKEPEFAGSEPTPTSLPEVKSPESDSSNVLQNINSVFGGGELI